MNAVMSMGGCIRTCKALIMLADVPDAWQILKSLLVKAVQIKDFLGQSRLHYLMVSIHFIISVWTKALFWYKVAAMPVVSRA